MILILRKVNGYFGKIIEKTAQIKVQKLGFGKLTVIRKCTLHHTGKFCTIFHNVNMYAARNINFELCFINQYCWMHEERFATDEFATL